MALTATQGIAPQTAARIGACGGGSTDSTLAESLYGRCRHGSFSAVYDRGLMAGSLLKTVVDGKQHWKPHGWMARVIL